MSIAAELVTIPPITDPLGQHWSQPARERILVDDTHALMYDRDFHGLAVYSTSIPTGTYLGKMWKAQRGNDWFLCWYDVDPDPTFLKIQRRLIVRVTRAGGEP